MVQWLRILLAIQVTKVGILVREDPTCHGPARSVGHNYRTWPLEPWTWNYRAGELKVLKPMSSRVGALQQEKVLQWEAQEPQLESSPRLPQLEKALAQQWRPSPVKNKFKKKKNFFLKEWLVAMEVNASDHLGESDGQWDSPQVTQPRVSALSLGLSTSKFCKDGPSLSPLSALTFSDGRSSWAGVGRLYSSRGGCSESPVNVDFVQSRLVQTSSITVSHISLD